MHARRSMSVVNTASNRAQSATGSELAPGVNGGKHLICLRDLTKNRGDSATTGVDLSPPDIKFVPPTPSTTKASPGSNFCRPPSSASRGSASSSPSAAEPAHATSAESPGAVGRRSNGSTADGPSSPGASGREARSPSSGSATAATTTTTTCSNDCGAAQGQLNKLKRFLATVQQFADDISPDIGDRVRTLVLALVNSQLCAEEFHRRLQEATNFPLRPFVVPFLKANLPLLQQELTSTNGRVSPPSPHDADRRVPGRPSTAQHDDSALTPATSLADHRQRLWYLGGLVPGVLLPRHDAGLDLNANGKRTFDRASDSPIDLKLDLFNPAIKRLHIDIPARPIQLPPGPGPAAPAFDQHGSLSAAFSSRPDDASTSSSTARDLSVDRNGPSTASSAITAPALGVRRQDTLGGSDGEDDWQAIDNVLQSIAAMVDRCRRAMLTLKDQCRRDRAALQARHGPHGPSPGGNGAASDGLTFNRSPTSSRTVDDLQVLQIRQLAEEAVNEVKRQAVAELHRAVTAAEVKATVAVTAERARLEKVVNEVRAQARQEAFALLNSQEDSTENCWNCGRKAYETCSGCHRARYCGTFCQHRHWETHHLACKPNQSTARSSPPAPAPRDGKSADHGRSPRSAESKSSAVRASSSGGAATAAVPEPPAIDFSTTSATAQRRNSTSPATSASVTETTSRPAEAGTRAEVATKTAAVV